MERRKFLINATLFGLSYTLPCTHQEKSSKQLTRIIPTSGESIPVIGMGSWRTFDVGYDQQQMNNMKNVLKTFLDLGGRVIDSSPMYGSSERVIGQLAETLNHTNDLWVSTKIWTSGRQSGINQLNDSNQYFHNRVKVHHVHNIRDFDVHYQSLKERKEQGQLSYVGATHYVNGMHDQLIEIIKQYPLDFIQINYNIGNIHAASRLLPFAADNGVAVIVNRPFQEGHLFDLIEDKPLPDFIKEFEIANWAQLMLKYIVSNPAVTCVIPATTQVAHVKENMGAGTGLLPDESMRTKMLKYYRSVV